MIATETKNCVTIMVLGHRQFSGVGRVADVERLLAAPSLAAIVIAVGGPADEPDLGPVPCFDEIATMFGKVAVPRV